MTKFLFFLLICLCYVKFLVAEFNCITSDNQQGICIHYSQCGYFNATANDLNPTSDEIEYMDDNICNLYSYAMFCCKKLLPEPVTQCGTIIPGDKIVKGNKTEMLHHPWAVPLYYLKKLNLKMLCGRSLINTKYVVTAAHCVHQSLLRGWKLKMVKLGVWNLLNGRECSNDRTMCADHQSIGIEKTVIHEEFSQFSVNRAHDIALLRLKTSVKYSNFIRPICLPPQTIVHPRYPMATAVGWGSTEHAKYSNYKMEANLYLVKQKNCQKRYRYLKLSENQMCAIGRGGSDSCNGDSGGPLVAEDSFSYPYESYLYLAGIVSYGPSKCGTSGWPGVYTNVSMYIPWIINNMRP